ncbi:MAG: PA0069 family radical SAM protein [Candidatus Hydrogenedentes bacterium]|nr:PA0069 family radical SAM protein [Candidatus Hydrogenedentota bacterium]
MTRARDEAALRGRGTAWNPANRFDGHEYERDDAVQACEDGPRPETEFLDDNTRSVLSRNESPDVGFEYSINPYRGCEHGCVYCYARPSHEYLGFSAGLDFETRILVKHKAPELLREALASPKWQPQPVAMSGNVDCYQPGERHFGITRKCLEVFAEFRSPVILITKNRLITRDIDLLQELAAVNGVGVAVSLTTLDLSLNRILEPRSSSPAQRLETIGVLSAAGIPVTALIAPVIPALTDHELPALVQGAADAGAQWASYIVLRLPLAVAPLFERWLEQHFPDRKEKVLNRVRSLRGGQLYKSEFGERMKGEGAFAAQLKQLFQVATKKAGLNQSPRELSTASFRRPGVDQMHLF